MERFLHIIRHMRYLLFAYLLLLTLASCNGPGKPTFTITHATDSLTTAGAAKSLPYADTASRIETGTITPVQVISFARTLKGIPYKYGSTNPAEGFDCSGFITYVFNHFGIAVPRTSVSFTSVPQNVELSKAKIGDLILFTGTDSTDRTVGHMGILVSTTDSLPVFIHSSSGKANGVTETPLNAYYQGRYVKTIRIFSQNN